MREVPLPTLEQALVDTAIVFCQDTRAVHGKTAPQTVFADQADYVVPTRDQQRVSTLISAWLDERKMHPILGDTPGPYAVKGTPTHFIGRQAEGAYRVTLYRTPDAAHQLVLDVAYAPLRDAVELDDNLYDLWVDALRAGTMARVYAIPDQPFSDMNKASAAAMSFIAQTAAAKRRMHHNQAAGSTMVTPRPFA